MVGAWASLAFRILLFDRPVVVKQSLVSVIVPLLLNLLRMMRVNRAFLQLLDDVA